MSEGRKALDQGRKVLDLAQQRSSAASAWCWPNSTGSSTRQTARPEKSAPRWSALLGSAYDG